VRKYFRMEYLVHLYYKTFIKPFDDWFIKRSVKDHKYDRLHALFTYTIGLPMVLWIYWVYFRCMFRF
jgi:hypothetical protein